MIWCPKLFVLYVLNCTVSKIHFGESSFFPLKSFYCLDRPQEDKMKDKKRWGKKLHTGNQRQNAHKECLVCLKKKKNNPLSLFIQSHTFVVMFFFMFIKTNVLPPLNFSSIFSWQKGYMGSIYEMNDVLLFTGDCNGIIDMHFILLVYKYEYIMNKSSYFIDVYLCGIFLKYQKHLIYVVLFSVFFFQPLA